MKVGHSEPKRLQSGETLESLGLSRWQKAKLVIFRDVFIGMEKLEGWTDFRETYLAICHKHGLFKTHPRGRGSLNMCPKCREEFSSKIGIPQNN